MFRTLALLVLALLVPALAVATELRLSVGADGRWSAPVVVAGVRLVVELDPDSQPVLLTAADAARLGLDHRRGVRMEVVVGGRALTARRVLLPSVRLEELTVTEVPALVVEAGLRRSVLGLDFLGRLKLRRREGELELSAPARQSPPGAVAPNR